MTKDEIENKIQLEIINVNKTIANKRRMIEPKKEKNEGTIWFFAWLECNPKKKEKENKKEKKRKTFLSQTTPNHNTHVI